MCTLHVATLSSIIWCETLVGLNIDHFSRWATVCLIEQSNFCSHLTISIFAMWMTIAKDIT